MSQLTRVRNHHSPPSPISRSRSSSPCPVSMPILDRLPIILSGSVFGFEVASLSSSPLCLPVPPLHSTSGSSSLAWPHLPPLRLQSEAVVPRPSVGAGAPSISLPFGRQRSQGLQSHCRRQMRERRWHRQWRLGRVPPPLSQVVLGPTVIYVLGADVYRGLLSSLFCKKVFPPSH